jgi:hypothetical protein
MGSYSNYQSAGVDFGALSQGPQWSKINPTQVGLTSGITNALSYGATGLQVGGPWAAAAGVALGGVKGAIDGLTARKEMHNENIESAKDFAYTQLNMQEQAAARQRASAAQNDQGYYSKAFSKKGGTLPLEFQTFLDEVKIAYKKAYGGKILTRETENKRSILTNFRAGGSLNVIPKGVYHGRKNAIGDKGIPVVVDREDGKMEKVAEIEHNELILRKKVTEEVEMRTRMYQQDSENESNLFILGSLIFNEVVNNTIDNQGELLKDGKTKTQS